MMNQMFAAATVQSMNVKRNLKEMMNDKSVRIFSALSFVVASIMAATLYVAFPTVFAAADATNSIITSLKGVLKLIATMIGAIFAASGIIKYIIAHANDNGSEQQKAMMFLASGAGLIIFGTAILPGLPIESWIDSSMKG
jgi:hypothetical protein